MASINTQNLYDSFVRKFSIGTNSASRFQASFLSSYNDVLFDLYNDGHITEPTRLTAVSANSSVEERFLPQVRIGIQHFLQSGESRDAYSQLNWEKAKTVWQEVDTSSTTYNYPWGT